MLVNPMIQILSPQATLVTCKVVESITLLEYCWTHGDHKV